MKAKHKNTFIGRLPHNEDLLGALTDVCKKKNIQLGTISVIGAVSNVVLGYYDQDKRTYGESVRLTEKMEIVSCSGNISLKDDEIFVHAHVSVADSRGICYGGHLMNGTIVFAAEYHITELDGKLLIRKPDNQTGLNLWSE
ncbi:MAG: DNA-binding protein [Candidatus Ancaeobacter aquaticus]|nr:DNA-binding protein [Candidatus Ancaeobacter aquaticus]